MKTRTLLYLMATLFASQMTQFKVFAQSNIVILTLEQSTDGLVGWEPIQVSEVVTPSTNAFYRMRIAMPTPTPPPETNNMITVQGGTLPESSQLAGVAVTTFQIGKYEVTWDEWRSVRIWAVTNGYTDLAIGAGSAGNHPVREVSWEDAVKWCNARSERDGLVAVYRVEGAVYRTGLLERTVLGTANGYRLPTDAEWEWAARGGTSSEGYTYSGGNDANLVAWYYDNSSNAPVSVYYGYGTWPVGTKAANELGIHDMSGNVHEWCWDRDPTLLGNRRYRGGGYSTSLTYLTVRRLTSIRPDIVSNSIGFRVARNAPE